MKLYDKKNKRLVMFEKKANSEFWDNHWRRDNFIDAVKKGAQNNFVKKYTAKFLKSHTKILEGGCGIGQNVYGLEQWGYDAHGVDFAEKTIEEIKKEFPKLKVSFQDVRKLNFPDNFFDGYWSLGVIEHFWDGYDKIIQEAHRTIKPNGYFFLTFPYVSPLRKIKMLSGLYEKYDNKERDNFYQFILSAKTAKRSVEKKGFDLILKKPFGATKGIKDEISFLKPILQRVHDSKSIFAKGIRFLNSILLSKVASHAVLLVFQKNDK